MSGAALALHQFRFDQKTFWRNPASVFFTVAFPVMFLVIFDLVFGNGNRIHIQGVGVGVSTYYVPAIITLAVISATFQNLAMSVTIDREFGILKRGRGTPLPDWVFFAGRIGNSLVVSLVMLVLLAAIGRIAYGVAIPWDRLPAVLVTLTVGAFTFCCLGLALTGFGVPRQDGAVERAREDLRSVGRPVERALPQGRTRFELHALRQARRFPDDDPLVVRGREDVAGPR